MRVREEATCFGDIFLQASHPEGMGWLNALIPHPEKEWLTPYGDTADGLNGSQLWSLAVTAQGTVWMFQLGPSEPGS